MEILDDKDEFIPRVPDFDDAFLYALAVHYNLPRMNRALLEHEVLHIIHEERPRQYALNNVLADFQINAILTDDTIEP